MTKKIIILFLCLLFLKAESQSFGALPYLDNNILPYYIEQVLWDSIHDKLLMSSKWCNYAGGKKVRGVWSWNGSIWDSLKGGLNTHDLLNNQANSTVLSGIAYNGKFLVGGTFQSIGSINATSLATWDGNVWDSLPVRAFKFLDYGAGVYDFINYDNKLFLCGIFDTIQNQKANSIATFNGLTFQPLSLPIQSQARIFDMAIYNEELYIGGILSHTAQAGDNYILKYDGTNWGSVGGGIKGTTGSVLSMVVYNNELYVAGYFLKANGNAGNIIMKWDGTNWKDVGWGNEFNNGSINKLLVHHNKLYAFGTFDSAANKPASKIAVFNGIEWCTFSDSLSQSIFSAAIYRDTVYVAGGFSNINGDTAKKLIAKLIYPVNYNQCVNVGNDEFLINRHKFIFPNPTSSILNITDEQNYFQSSIIEIKNALGQVIKSVPFQKEIDVSFLQSGMYFIEIKNSNGNSYSAKFIKQ